MLYRHRNSNEWPTYAPFALFDYQTPERTFGNLRQDLERVFGSYERSLTAPIEHSAENAQLRDSGTDLTITVDLPGVSKKDVELSISGDNIFIRAARTLTPPNGYTAHRRERGSFEFEHAFKLPVPVETEKAEAKLQDGVLIVTLPKAPSAQPKQIVVKAG
jgi:HSP20 family protein